MGLIPSAAERNTGSFRLESLPSNESWIEPYVGNGDWPAEPMRIKDYVIPSQTIRKKRATGRRRHSKCATYKTIQLSTTPQIWRRYTVRRGKRNAIMTRRRRPLAQRLGAYSSPAFILQETVGRTAWKWTTCKEMTSGS